jgi:RecA-family ATPase
LIPTLKIITMRDVKPETVEWLWEPYIPYGKITLLQGDPGDGKTTTATAIAAAVSTGATLPGGGRTTPSGVIIQNAEDGLADTTIPRLERFGADVDRVYFIDEDESLSLSDERIESAIVRTGARLCILDPIQAYLGGANMNSANGIRSLMKRLGDVAAWTGCAMLLVGHMNKSGGKSQYRSLGSVDIYAAARSVLTVGRIPQDTQSGEGRARRDLCQARCAMALGAAG